MDKIDSSEYLSGYGNTVSQVLSDRGSIWRGLEPTSKIKAYIETMDEPKQVLEPVLVVKKHGLVLDNEIKKKIGHHEKLRELKGSSLYRGFTIQLLNQLERIGAVWLVDRNFVSRFNYAASIGPGIYSTEHCVIKNNSMIVYVGDIPEVILDKALLIKRMGINYFSVHSQYPFPIEEFELPKVDPVMIAWPEQPWIHRRGTCWDCSENVLGIVVGIWDGEKEIEVL